MPTRKEAYYFSHDSNAKDDPKCVLLIEQLGLEGYGIFWVLIETLREQTDYSYPLRLVPALARRFNTTAEKMYAVIKNYELFQISDDNFFFSESLNDRMKKMNQVRKKRKQAAMKRWHNENQKALQEQSKSNANALQEQSKIMQRKGKEKKGNEIKGKNKEGKKFTPPTLKEIKEYFKSNGYSEKAAEKAYWYYHEADWHDSRGNKIKNWKQKCRGVWFKEENEIKQETSKRAPKVNLYR
jgi:hypothetical protein